MASPRRTDAAPVAPGATVLAVEIEQKFEPGEGFALPDLTAVPGVASVTDPVRHDLDAVYFDTADLRLASAKITLRRRTGGEDAGWHLKRPRTDGARNELRAPLGRATRTVPAVLRAPVESRLRGARLAPVVRLSTTREVRLLLDAAGTPLAEIALDQVVASEPPARGSALGPALTSWSELEVELVDGDRALLAAVAAAVEAAGARPSRSASKLAQALGDRVPPPRRDRPKGIKRSSGGAALLEHLGEHIERLVVQDPLVREDQHDAVHQMRVATRRLRSALATFRPLLDREVTDPLRDELAWLGDVLGAARDAEVIRDHLAGLVAAEPEGLVAGPVAERIATTLGERYRAAHDAVIAELDGGRYHALLDRLEALRADPPLSPLAAGPADETLLPRVVQSYRRTRRLVRTAEAETDPVLHDELLHDVRKAAKRARYAGEALVPRYGKPAKRWAKAMEAIQESLGEHQDSVVVRAEILAIAAVARAAGEDTFTYGRLHAAEEARAAATEHRFEAMWAAAADPALHAWLRA